MLQDGRQIPVQFTNSIFANYVFISHNKVKVMIEGHKKLCDKITNEQIQTITTNSSLPQQQYESRRHFCVVLTQHLWKQEFLARIKFLVDKTIVWRV